MAEEEKPKRRRRTRDDRSAGAKVALRARRQLGEITGLEPQAVTSLERQDDGTWRVTVELLELSRLPETDDLLQARHDELTQLLERFDGRVQMTLKVSYNEERVLREILESNDEIAQLREAVRGSSKEESRDARIRLGEMVNAAIEERRERDGAEILEQLKSVSLAGVPQPLENELMVLNAPLLVERKQLDAFEDAVDEVAKGKAELMRFKLLGPMPAYHFIDLEEPARA